MITYLRGNLLIDDADVLVNAVNCVGVMGAGIALQFKITYPDYFEVYRAACGRKEIHPGTVFVYEFLGDLKLKPRIIISFPTKRHWQDKTQIVDIATGLTSLVEELKSLSIKSMAVPALGCGCGGVLWSAVNPIIQSAAIQVPEIEWRQYLPR